MILYIGNKLSSSKGSVSFIETLTPLLNERYKIKAVSAFSNRLMRILHMLFTVLGYHRVTSVIIIDCFSTRAFWFAYLTARLSVTLGVPYIAIVRGGDFESRLNKSPEACRFLFNRSERNIVPSRYLKSIFDRYNILTDIIPNFIEIEKYLFKKREPVMPKLLWVRAFHPIYNPIMALEVIVLLKQQYPNVCLCMVGPDRGMLDEVLRRRDQWNLNENVSIKGALRKEEWCALASDYDFFINTTNVDNMPVSVIEAMALGLVVISTNAGGIPFILNDSEDSIVVPRNSASSMSEAISKILTNQHMAGFLSCNARKKAESFSWHCVKEQWFRLLDKYEKVRFD